MNATRTRTRVANRVRSDELVDALLDATPCNSHGWVRIDDLVAAVSRRRVAVESSLLYLEHNYGAVHRVGLSGAYVTVSLDGICRYLVGDRTPCTTCNCAGEHER